MKYCIYQSKSLLIWVLPNNEEQKEISHQEKIIARELSDEKSKQFKYSRGYIRFFLSQLFKINPLEVELYANPGEAPELSSKFGYLSISHTYDALAISWSIYKVGIDIERFDRKIYSLRLLKKFLNSPEIFEKFDYSNEGLRFKLLQIWVLKEALVKRERTSIAYGFKNWKINSEFNNAINIFNNQEVLIKSIKYEEWILGVACNEK